MIFARIDGMNVHKVFISLSIDKRRWTIKMTFKNYKKKKQKRHQELVRKASQEVIKRIAKVYQRSDGNDERRI